MNYFNHKNVQLAYEAVYNQDLCESMEDLGLIDDYDYLEEERDPDHPHWQTNAQYKRSKRRNKEKLEQRKATSRKSHQNLNFFGGSPLSRLKGKLSKSPRNQKEEVELCDIILEYLIQEGYADTLGSAEIILENMSEEWIEDILSEAEYMGDTRKSARKLNQAAHQKAKALKNDRGEVERIFGGQVRKGEKEKTLADLAIKAGLRAQRH